MGRKDYYHNKGQQDYSEGRYEPPHGLLDDLLTWGSSGMQSNLEENRAYDDGYSNARDQDS